MTLADQYAKVLHDAVQKNPAHAPHYVANLREALKRRGHEKLMPRILHAYENLEASKKRREQLHTQTPEARRTRILVELYRKLITS